MSDILILDKAKHQNYIALVHCVQARSCESRKKKKSRSPNHRNLRGRKLLRKLQDQDYCCLDCGKEFECSGTMKYDGVTIEHIIPYRFGSAANDDNIALLCEECNQKRDDEFSLEIIEAHFGKLTEDEIEDMKKIQLGVKFK